MNDRGETMTTVIRGASSLLANNQGSQRCFYCGDLADKTLKVSDTFADGWQVAFPSSKWMCQGCAISLNESMPIAGKEKLQKFRNYSWHITRSHATPLTKANKTEIATLLLNPPNEPWAFAIAESGQKHLAYRTPANVRHIRVDGIGGSEGTSFGRREWEMNYYADELRRLER